MSGSDLTTPPPSPRIPGNIVPADTAGVLERLADERRVTMGPGGRTDIVEDTAAGLPPSQSGIGGTLGKHLVLTNEPHPDEPQFAGLGNWSIQLGTALAYTLTGIPLPPDLGTQAGAANLEEELAFIQSGTDETIPGRGADETTVSPPTIEEGAPQEAETVLDQWLTSLWEGVPTDPAMLPPEVGVTIERMQSNKPEDVYEALLEMANLESMDLSQVDREAVIAQLNQLAQTIANANDAGGSVVLNLTVPELVSAFLAGALTYQDDPAVSSEHKELFNTVISTVGQNLASINFDSLIGVQEPSQEYQDLTSGEPTQIATLLASLLSTRSLPEGLSQSGVNAIVGELSLVLSAGPPATSPNPANVEQMLREAIESLTAQGKISPLQAELFSTELLPILSQDIAQINETKLLQDTRSTNPTTVESALIELTGAGSDPALSEAENKFVMDYLKALTVALSFMAQIRCLISTLENEFSQELAIAKMNTIADQVSQASNLFMTKVQEITTGSVDYLKSLSKQKLMRILMPLIAIAVAITSIILIVASIAATVATGGAAGATIAASAAVVGKLIALTVGLVTASAALAITVADAACQWTASKGLFEMLGEAMGVEDPAAIAAISMAFQVLIMVIVAVCTLGAGLAVGAARLVSIGAETAMKTAVSALGQAALRVIREEGLRRALVGSIQMGTLTALFLGTIMTGIVPALSKGLIMALKEAGMDEKDAAILATIIIMLLVLVSMVALQQGRSGIKAGLQSIPGVVRGAATSLKSSLDSMRQVALNALNRIENFLRTGLTSSNASLSAIVNRILEQIATFARKIAETLRTTLRNIPDQARQAREAAQAAAQRAGTAVRDALQDIFRSDISFAFYRTLGMITDAIRDIAPTTALRVMTVITEGISVATAAIQAEASRTHAEHLETLAGIKEEAAGFESMLVFLTQLQGVDQTQTIDNITESTQEASDNWLRLVQMVGSFINNASQNLTTLTSRGAA